MDLSRRKFFVSVIAILALPKPSRAVEFHGITPLLTRCSSLITSQAAARRLGRFCASVLGPTNARLLVQDQERRIATDTSRVSRAWIGALIAEDFRTGRTIEVGGLCLSRLEAGLLIAAYSDALRIQGSDEKLY